jgi:DNA-binding NarL/FixJ family response regulator
MAGSDTPSLDPARQVAGDESPAPIPVLIVSSVRLYRDGLAALLAQDESVEVVGAALDVDQAIDLATRVPALVLFDAMTPESDADIRLLRARIPDVSILALTVRDREQDMLELAEAGVHGFVTVEASLEELAAAIGSAARGEAICSPTLAAAFMRRIASLSHEQEPPTVDAALTVREREILELVQEGLSNKQIAQRLRIQLSTAKNHVHSILGKLGVERRAEVVALGRGRVPSVRR